MVLSDKDIKRIIKSGKLVFVPELKAGQIGPASVDLRLSPEFKLFDITKQTLLDPKKGLPRHFMTKADMGGMSVSLFIPAISFWQALWNM